MVGDYFAPAQGGRFSSPQVAAALGQLERHGGHGVGQSSWGPTGFAFAASADEAERLADRLRRSPEGRGLDIRVCVGAQYRRGHNRARTGRCAGAVTMTDKDGRGTLADKHILHMLTPLKHMSPFDVNMAVDAGFDAVIPYTAVTLEEIQGLVQDAIFSRPPKGGVNTAVFIGGKNAGLALDMLAAARKALVPPFGISFFADPAGSFTTAAAMIACVEKTLRGKMKRNLKGTSIVVFGATGVVGYSAAVLAALEGAEVTLVGHDGIRRVAAAGADIKARFDVEVAAADGSDEERKTALLAGAEVALCAGRAGVEILSRPALDAAKKLLVVADVNAVPPAGVAGLDMGADGAELNSAGALGIGPLTIGNVKYKTEFGLFEKIIAAKKPVSFDFRDAFALAREING